MQIPKQPRTKVVAEASQPDAKPVATEAGSASTTEELNGQLQQSYASYNESVNAATLQAQLDLAKAYLAYLEALQQQSASSGPDHTLEYWKEVLKAPDDVPAILDAHAKFALANVDRQSQFQKALIEASTVYSQNVRDIWAKLQSDMEKHNQEIADSLKDVLLKVNASAATIPALSLLYQNIRTMGGTPVGEAAKAG